MAHFPVLSAEAIELLAIRPDGIYLDATAGLGGHTAEIARRLTSGLLIANDRDADSLAQARANTAEWAERIRFHQGTFSTLREAVAVTRVRQVHGLLAHPGGSRHQLSSSPPRVSIFAGGPPGNRLDQFYGL